MAKAKRVFIALMSTMLVIGILPATASADEVDPKSLKVGETYKDERGELCIRGGDDTATCIGSWEPNPEKAKESLDKALADNRLRAKSAAVADDRFCPIEAGQRIVHLSRVSVCSGQGLKLTKRRLVPPFDVMGTMNVMTWQWLDYNRLDLQWPHTTAMVVEAADGDLATETVTLTLTSLCDREFDVTCKSVSSDPADNVFGLSLEGPAVIMQWQETLWLAPPAHGWQHAVPLTGFLGVSAEFRGSWMVNNPLTWTFDGSDEGNGEKLSGRCDNNDTPPNEGNPNGTINRGCVDHKFIPIMEFNGKKRPKVAPVAQHVYDRQIGAWGDHRSDVVGGANPNAERLPTQWGMNTDDGFPLHRTQIQSEIDANRRIACPSSRPSSCDEWPMASTKEGAAYRPQEPGIPQDWSWRQVPEEANDSQGATMGNFYRNNRVIHGDAYWVRAITANGDKSW